MPAWAKQVDKKVENLFGCMVVTQWRSQGLQSRGDDLSGKGTNTVGDPENFEIQSL
jgi:hypothetical protein